MKITFYHRRPTQIHYSLELLFAGIRKHLPLHIQTSQWISPFFSEGLWPRIKMTLAARMAQADINHITGDIHFIALGLKKQKTILTIHDLGILNNTTNPIARWLLKTFWITLPIKCVSIVTVVSEATKHELLRVTGISPSKIRVIGNFIPESFKASPKEFNQLGPRILHIGSAYNKNLDRLIEALEGVTCRLIIIGHPTPQQKQLLIEKNINHEIYSGFTEEELIAQYQQCDLLSFVSLLEGFGLPILEAQATGRAVVTSNLSSMPEVAGKGACLVDPYNISAIREGIIKVIQDRAYREMLIAEGFENVKRFNINTVTQQYVELYQEIYEGYHRTR